MNSYVIKQYKTIASLTYVYFSYRLIIIVLIYMIEGAILGIEHFLEEIRKAGRWKLNLPKMIFMGIPSLYFALYPILAYSAAANKIYLPIVNSSLLNSSLGYITIFEVIFGYCIITSFYKHNEEKSTISDVE